MSRLDAMVVWWRPRANMESCKAGLFSPFQRMWKSCFAWQARDFVTVFRRVIRCGHVVLRGRRGSLLHSTCVRCKTVARLKLPSLWEKSHKPVFFDVSEAVLMSFCVAGVALCDIPRV